MSKCLVLLAKRPRKGKVKTRLSNSIGEDEAFRIYQEILHKTNQTLLKTGVPVKIFLTGEGEYLPPSSFEIYEQQKGDVGMRMQHAISKALQTHDQVVLVGSDIPDLSPGIIAKAFTELEQKEVVLGPSEDGGYYLIGMRKMHASLFQGVTWSTSSVLTETLRKCAEEELSVSLVDTLNDIDTEADWKAYQSRKVKEL